MSNSNIIDVPRYTPDTEVPPTVPTHRFTFLRDKMNAALAAGETFSRGVEDLTDSAVDRFANFVNRLRNINPRLAAALSPVLLVVACTGTAGAGYGEADIQADVQAALDAVKENAAVQNLTKSELDELQAVTATPTVKATATKPAPTETPSPTATAELAAVLQTTPTTGTVEKPPVATATPEAPTEKHTVSFTDQSKRRFRSGPGTDYPYTTFEESETTIAGQAYEYDPKTVLIRGEEGSEEVWVQISSNPPIAWVAVEYPGLTSGVRTVENAETSVGGGEIDEIFITTEVNKVEAATGLHVDGATAASGSITFTGPTGETMTADVVSDLTVGIGAATKIVGRVAIGPQGDPLLLEVELDANGVPAAYTLLATADLQGAWEPVGAETITETEVETGEMSTMEATLFKVVPRELKEVVATLPFESKGYWILPDGRGYLPAKTKGMATLEQGAFDTTKGFLLTNEAGGTFSFNLATGSLLNSIKWKQVDEKATELDSLFRSRLGLNPNVGISILNLDDITGRTAVHLGGNIIEYGNGNREALSEKLILFGDARNGQVIVERDTEGVTQHIWIFVSRKDSDFADGTDETRGEYIAYDTLVSAATFAAAALNEGKDQHYYVLEWGKIFGHAINEQLYPDGDLLFNTTVSSD